MGSQENFRHSLRLAADQVKGFLLFRKYPPVYNYLTGEGIDYTNPVFRNPDGSSRILAIWNQTIQTVFLGARKGRKFCKGNRRCRSTA